jgi:hypothetical protein
MLETSEVGGVMRLTKPIAVVLSLMMVYSLRIMAVMESAISFLQLCGFSAALGFATALVWTPFLASDRVRALFSTLGWSDGWLVSYSVVMTIIGAGAFLLFAVVGVLGDTLYSLSGMDTPAENAFFWQGLVVGYIVYTFLLWFIPVVVLPRVGTDWDPHGYDMTTKALFGVGVLWFQIGGTAATVLIASTLVFG